VAVVALAVLATLLAVCSQSDAFVASSFVHFSRVAQLTFMVVGPVVDVKLIAMHIATFGRRFALRLACTTFVAAVATSCAVGAVLL
jgi:uncharacterized membrane protein YraQ (UPF0718 family)